MKKRETKRENLMFERMSDIVKFVLVPGLLLFISFILYGSGRAEDNIDNIYSKNDTVILFIDEAQPVHIIPQYDSVRLMLIDETTRYIARHTRSKNRELAEQLVDNALEHNIDLCFMLSQTKIETCFGTTGIGRPQSKRSLFGISNNRVWSNYNDAIGDYCRLLKEKYLVRGKTEKDLMRRYVNSKGHRYATSANYESELRAAYSHVVRTTNISQLQQQYYDILYNDAMYAEQICEDNDSADIII